MALDSKAKRASIPGVGRPWYRTKQPAANSVAWRIASGNAYGGNAIAAPVYYFNPRLGTFTRANVLPLC